MFKNISSSCHVRSASCTPVQGCPPLETRNVAKVTHTDCFTDLSLPLTGLIKTPVVIGLTLAQIDIEAVDTLPVPARALKSVRKNVHFTQCRLVPTLPGLAPKLFLGGFVHKNIQFIDASSGIVRDHEVNVPFECTIRLDNIPNPPVIPSDKNVFNTQFIETSNGMDENRCVTGGRTFEWFNEPFECEVVFAATNEVDLLEDFDRFGTFKTIREKLDVIALILITQKQLAGATTFAGIGGLAGLPAGAVAAIAPILAGFGVTLPAPTTTSAPGT
ncbi:MAG: hypothetical protein Q8935_16220 [Bacillota bacterium]|nr:hypothetical protein [Bacillota bacterium]MDP4155785.1 hypothetical protein [Bacillota bacterium]